MSFAAKPVSKASGAFALALVSTLALAACGGDAQVSDERTDDVVETNSTPAPGAAEAPASDETPTADATPGSTPTATPSATAAPSPTPTPTPVAAATQPPQFAVCAACHSTERGDNGIGPTLAGVFGRRAGTVPGFEYSEAMKSSGLTWNQSNLDRFLNDPRAVVPGTTMAYPGLKDAAQRQAMIAYLRGL